MQVNIKPYRIGLNLSISALADKVRISRAHMSNIERNLEFPSGDVLKKISEALNVCPYELIDLCTNCSFENCYEDKFFLHNK